MTENLLQFFNKPLLDFVMPLNTVNLFELAIIAITIYVFYIKYIKGTQSEKLLKGIFMLLIALLLSKFLILLKLQILGKFLESLVSIVIFGLVVIFQPELRRFLGYLGQPGFLSKNLFHSGESTDETGAVEEITEAIKYLGKSRTGALIVLQNTFEGTHYFEVGTKLNAQISTELILTIFHPNTALHDGAMVIKNNKILSAGVLLPLTEDPKLSWQYGTRHRAAIGMTEISDAVCIVVSEETGHVSISQNGLLTKIETIDELKEKLNQLYGINTDETVITKTAKKFSFNNIFFGETNKFPGILEKKDIINK